MATFVTDADVLTTLAACLGQAEASLPPHWGVLVAKANVAASNAVVTALADRGFTVAEIAAWDRAAEFNEQLALCRAFRMAALRGETFDPATIADFCKYADQLATIGITIDGELIPPGGDASRASFGEFNTAGDPHTIDDQL